MNMPLNISQWMLSIKVTLHPTDTGCGKQVASIPTI
jgi:hypothetical protein